MFDYREYKDVIMSAAWNAGSKYVSILESKHGDYEPTIVLGTWSLREKEKMRGKFLEALIELGLGDEMWNILVMPAATVKDGFGKLIIDCGDWIGD